MNLTTQEMIILLILIVAIGGVLSFLFKSAIKIIVAVMLIASLWTICFDWLPTQWEQIQNSNTTPGEVVNGVKNTIVSEYENSGVGNTVNGLIETGSEWVDENKDSWLDSAQSLFHKLLGIEMYEE